MTPILETILPLVREYGATKARLWIEGSEELAKPDDDLCSFLARNDVEWDQLDGTDQDTIREAYIGAVAAAVQPVRSDSVSSDKELLREVRGLLEKIDDALNKGWSLHPGTSGHMEISSVLKKLQSATR